MMPSQRHFHNRLIKLSTILKLGLLIIVASNLYVFIKISTDIHKTSTQSASITGPVQDIALSNALEKIKARNAYLCEENTDKSQWGWKTGGPPRFHTVPSTTASVISLLQPTYACPWTLHRTNYVSQAPNFDGGKWTCGIKEMKEYQSKRKRKKPCIVYSFGSNGDDFFEADILKQNPHCEIHIFDPTLGSPPSSWEAYHFHDSGLCIGNATSFTLKGTNTYTKANGRSDTSYKCQSLQSHMKELGHSYVDIFKADVEGMEWELTSHWGSETKIGQILLEFHFWVISPPFPELLREHIIPLEKLGYFIHTLEPVAAKIDAYEITFLNVNWRPDGYHQSLFQFDMYPTTPNVAI